MFNQFSMTDLLSLFWGNSQSHTQESLRLSCYCFWFIEPHVQTRRQLTRTAFSTGYKLVSVEESQIPYWVSLEEFGKQQGQWEVVLGHKMTTNEKMYHDPLKTSLENVKEQPLHNSLRRVRISPSWTLGTAGSQWLHLKCIMSQKGQHQQEGAICFPFHSST